MLALGCSRLINERGAARSDLEFGWQVRVKWQEHQQKEEEEEIMYRLGPERVRHAEALSHLSQD